MTAPTPPPLRVEPERPPLPQPEDQPAHIDDAHLFGASLFGTAVAGGVRPTPVVAIGGVDVASGPDSSLTFPMVMDGLSITWGRTQVMDQPDPATATLSIFDPTATWAVGRELIGQLLTISWQAVRPSDGVTQRVPAFVGRLTAARLTRRTVTRSDGVKVHGTVIVLGAASLLNDLANLVPAADWPAETMDQRRARIAGLAANVCTGGVAIRNYWKTPGVAPVAIGSQVSVLDHLLSLYQSSGPDRMTFLPATQLSAEIERRDFPGSRTMGILTWNVAGEGTARDGKGAYIRSVNGGTNDAGLTGSGMYLDSDVCEYPASAGLTKDITARITRVDVAHTDSANAYGNRVETALVSSVDPAVTETTFGVRAARYDSIVAWNDYAAQAASDLAYMAAREATGWHTDAITIRTDLRVDGFESFAQLSYLLTGGEVLSNVFVQRSWFVQLGIRPIFGIIGGTIHYAAGEWQLDARLAPINTLPTKQHAISWSEIDDGSTTYELQWWDDDNPRGLHESLTYEDIGFVGYGLGMVTVPADQGWDEVYPK